MNTVKKIEISHLNLRYEHTRIRRPSVVLKMGDSIERFGQLMPVLVVNTNEATLIDGYLRVKALKRMGQDLVTARIWDQTEPDALVYMLSNMQKRQWDVYEEAAIINELKLSHRMPLARIAALLGKNKSWVTRRLSLFETLDDEMIGLIRKGNISSWSAQRILVPLARANPEHSKSLIQALKKENIPTRRLSLLFTHYQKSNRTIRQNMIDDPHLFLKVLENKSAQKESRTLQEGPEGKWLKDIRTTKHILSRLSKSVPEVFYPGQSRLDRRRLLTAVNDAFEVMKTLMVNIQRMDDDQRGKTSDDFIFTSVRMRNPAHQQASQGIA